VVDTVFDFAISNELGKLGVDWFGHIATSVGHWAIISGNISCVK
jgi:hypothetical protein